MNIVLPCLPSAEQPDPSLSRIHSLFSLHPEINTNQRQDPLYTLYSGQIQTPKGTDLFLLTLLIKLHFLQSRPKSFT